MKQLTPLKLAIVGIATYGASVLWVWLYHYLARRDDPPGWIVERATPDAPKYLALVAAAIVAVSLFWAATRLTKAQLQKHTQKNPPNP